MFEIPRVFAVQPLRMSHLHDLFTPSLIVDEVALRANIAQMQSVCDANGVALWPHVKTHKTVEIARLQLLAGAQGLTCAKLGEAEALLVCGVRRLFVAYPLVDVRYAKRLRFLADHLDELVLAATSLYQVEALGRVLDAAGISVSVLVAIDSGLHREGARTAEQAAALVRFVRQHKQMRLRGLFTHEGHTYGATSKEQSVQNAQTVHAQLLQVLQDLGEPGLTLWPGSSMTAQAMASLPDVYAVRPGAYVFGDLLLSATGFTPALFVLATVVDRPSPELALVDAGSKTLSSDKTPNGVHARLQDEGDMYVGRVSEEHGWVFGPNVGRLGVGNRGLWIPAHACPVVNLANELTVMNGEQVVDRWQIVARGKVQ
jgi:D-serine deaminase-like pyridoxal phosphate-dependent protein